MNAESSDSDGRDIMIDREPVRRAEAAMRAGDFATAVQLCDAFLQENPSDLNATYLKGQAMSNMQKDDEALILFDRALHLAGPASELYPLILHNKGNTLLWLDKLNEAEECYDKALRIKPGLGRAWIEKARIAYRRGLFGDSVKCCDNALSINPSSPRAFNNKAAALLELGRLDEAIACGQKAVDLQPRYVQAWVFLSKAYKKKGDMKRARTCENLAQELVQKSEAIFEGYE